MANKINHRIALTGLLIIVALCSSSCVTQQIASVNLSEEKKEIQLCAPFISVKNQSINELIQSTANCSDEDDWKNASKYYFTTLIRLSTIAQFENSKTAIYSRKTMEFQQIFENDVLKNTTKNINELIDSVGTAISYDIETPFLELDEISSLEKIHKKSIEPLRIDIRNDLNQLIIYLLKNKDQIYLSRMDSGQKIEDPWWDDHQINLAIARKKSGFDPSSPVIEIADEFHDHGDHGSNKAKPFNLGDMK